MLGMFKPPIWFAIFPNVSAPTSSYFPASGASPIPTESITIKNIRLNNAISITSFTLLMLLDDMLYTYLSDGILSHGCIFGSSIYLHARAFLGRFLNQLHF